MHKVLFVCLGNICRSPMAEAVFRDLVKRENLQEQFIIDSAGTGPWHAGKQPHPGTMAILKDNNVDNSKMIARQLRVEDFYEFNYIIVMDQQNLLDAQAVKPRNSDAIVARLLDYASTKVQYDDVPDPYYVGGFDKVYDMVLDGCQGLLQAIKERQGNN